MISVLSIENAQNWSWGIASGPLKHELERRGYRFVNFTRRPKQMIEQSLIDFFDLTLVQNADNLALIAGNRKKVITRMGGMVIDKKNKPTRYDHWLAQVGAVVSVNKQLHAISCNVNEKAFLIPNPVDLERFRQKPEVMRWPNRKVRLNSPMRNIKLSCPPQESKQPFTIGFAGNIWGMGGEYKGWQPYVQATIDLEAKHGIKHIESLHNGPGHQKQIPHERMCEDFYWQIDALILPSINEGCSNVTAEALACGVPVLSTKVGYHGDMLAEGGNVLWIERNHQDIVDIVLALKEDDTLYKRLCENGRQFIDNFQSVATIANQYDDVFRVVLKHSRH